MQLVLALKIEAYGDVYFSKDFNLKFVVLFSNLTKEIEKQVSGAWLKVNP